MTVVDLKARTDCTRDSLLNNADAEKAMCT